jgi:hypothetical protein
MLSEVWFLFTMLPEEVSLDDVAGAAGVEVAAESSVVSPFAIKSP